MYESSLEYLRCVSCRSKLDLRIFEMSDEVDEGILRCTKCKNQYLVISSIALLLDDLSLYFSTRSKLGGSLMSSTKNPVLKHLIKDSLKKITKVQNDTTELELNWIKIYKKSKHAKFYSKIKNELKKLPKLSLALEHGCSIGIISKELAKNNEHVFGIDKSFFAIQEAKKQKIKNCDFFVADSLFHPFGYAKFDVVVALNVLELIEPMSLLHVMSSQSKQFLLLSDPYDFERGKNSIKIRLDDDTLRKKISQMRFRLLHGTTKPSFIPWTLTVNPRLKLHYKVDLILARKYRH